MKSKNISNNKNSKESMNIISNWWRNPNWIIVLLTFVTIISGILIWTYKLNKTLTLLEKTTENNEKQIMSLYSKVDTIESKVDKIDVIIGEIDNTEESNSNEFNIIHERIHQMHGKLNLIAGTILKKTDAIMKEYEKSEE